AGFPARKRLPLLRCLVEEAQENQRISRRKTMFRSLLFAGVAALGLVSAPAADAQVIVGIRTPVVAVQTPIPLWTYAYEPTIYRVGAWHTRHFHSLYAARDFEARMIYHGYDAYMVRCGFDYDVYF